MPHNHSHHHHEITGKNLTVSIYLNIGITVAQIVGGFISGSLALISDALHNFSDVLSLVFSLVAHRLSKRKATVTSTFGYKRAELIAAFVNSATLIVVALFLIYEAIERFSNPQIIGSGLVIWLSLLGILFNGFSTLLLKKDADHSSNMKSAYLHLLSDTVASVAVLAGGLLMKYYEWFWVDSVITFGIAVYLIFLSFGLLKSTTKMLMLFTPENLDIIEIVKKIHDVTGIHQLHHVHLWNLNDNERHFEAHLECRENIPISEFNAIASQIKEVLHHDFNISHSTIQPEFGLKCSHEVIVQD